MNRDRNSKISEAVSKLQRIRSRPEQDRRTQQELYSVIRMLQGQNEGEFL